MGPRVVDVKLVPIYAIVVGGVVALRRFARAELPSASVRSPGLTCSLPSRSSAPSWPLAWLFVTSNPGAGLYAMALGSVVMFVGALLSELRAGEPAAACVEPDRRAPAATPTRAVTSWRSRAVRSC